MIRSRNAEGALQPSELKQIIENINQCEYTKSLEKKIFKEIIESKVKSHSYSGLNIPASLADSISSEIYKISSSKNFLFKGPKREPRKDISYWHAKLADRFLHTIATALLVEDEKDGKQNRRGLNYYKMRASSICTEFRRADGWRRVIEKYASLPLHRHGFPFWIADITEADPTPHNGLDSYPGRAGLAPDNIKHLEYVLVKLRPKKKIFKPRFADSGGYVHWRPGGKTKPIAECEEGHSGFDEFIADELSVGDIVSAPIHFRRSV